MVDSFFCHENLESALITSTFLFYLPGKMNDPVALGHIFTSNQIIDPTNEYQAIDQTALNQKQGPLIVHYVWLHDNTNKPQDFCFLDCMSVLSVMKFLKPDAIHLHTNLPDFWPFDPCNELISNWTGVKLVNAKRRFVVGGKRIKRIEHEVDVLKLELVRDVGGVALDFDVFMVNGTKLRELLTVNPCVVCTENEPKLNAGFLACRKGAAYPQMLLQKSYAEDFRPDLWIWNSGEVPHRLLAEHNTTAYVAQDICNSPDWIHRVEFLSSSERKFDWRNRIAHHSYLHDRGYTRETLKTANNSMADFLKWVLTADPVKVWVRLQCCSYWNVLWIACKMCYVRHVQVWVLLQLQLWRFSLTKILFIQHIRLAKPRLATYAMEVWKYFSNWKVVKDSDHFIMIYRLCVILQSIMVQEEAYISDTSQLCRWHLHAGRKSQSDISTNTA